MVHTHTDAVVSAFPHRLLTMDEAIRVDTAVDVSRCIPLVVIGDADNITSWSVAVVCTQVEDDHLLVGFDGTSRVWTIIERNAASNAFTRDGADLCSWVATQNAVSDDAVVMYEANCADYPRLGNQ